MLDDFLFGTASSAYQIEGAWNEDGKAPSIWDTLSHTEGYVRNGHTGNIACNHYHEWDRDVDLMKIMGAQTYRFSISWPRIITGPKKTDINKKGIEFYKGLVNKLLECNIEPFVTLYHWDLPQWLDDIGGWGNKKIIKEFVRFADVMYDALPEVKYWITFNEPAVFLPNRWGHNDLPSAIKNVLLSHGSAVQSFHDNHKGNIGISLNLMPAYPHVEGDKKDEKAADNVDKYHNQIWLKPIFDGKFPDGINELYRIRDKQLHFSKNQSELVSQPTEFLGINYYAAMTIKHADSPPLNVRVVSSNCEKDEMGIEIKPHGLFDICRQIHYVRDIDMYITENGRACPDVLCHDGRIHDDERIRYISNHLAYCDRAVKKGFKLKGYFYWSLMDNFEWRLGYNKRFGLIYILYLKQVRIPKNSYHWYSKVIKDKKFRDAEVKI